MTAQGDLFAPAHTRTVNFACPCGTDHPTEIPARWKTKPRTLWTHCPTSGQPVTVIVEPRRRVR